MYQIKAWQSVFEGIYKDASIKSRTTSIWGRMKENYPSFVFDKDSDTTARDVAGKKFILIDDNSSTGRTFVGLRNFIKENGGRVIGYYALTTGHDQSEKMVTTDETWNEILSIGLETISDFAEKDGVKREISKLGITEREAQELIKQFRGKETDTGRGGKAGARSEGSRGKIREIYGKNGSTEKSNKVKFSFKDYEVNTLSEAQAEFFKDSKVRNKNVNLLRYITQLMQILLALMW